MGIEKKGYAPGSFDVAVAIEIRIFGHLVLFAKLQDLTYYASMKMFFSLWINWTFGPVFAVNYNE